MSRPDDATIRSLVHEATRSRDGLHRSEAAAALGQIVTEDVWAAQRIAQALSEVQHLPLLPEDDDASPEPFELPSFLKSSA